MMERQMMWVDLVRCTGCGACIDVCPVGAMALIEGKARVDEDACTGCEACVHSCPMQALKVVHKTPDQKETEGYNVNLRNENYINLGLVDDSRIVPPIMQNRQPRTPGKPKPKAKE